MVMEKSSRMYLLSELCDCPGRLVVAGDEQQTDGFGRYLRSPIVELVVGSGDEQTLLLAHRALLEQSPWFADELTRLDADAAVGCSAPYLTLQLPD